MPAITSTKARRWCSQGTAGFRMTRDESLRFMQPGEHKVFIVASEEHRLIKVLAREFPAFRNEEFFSGGLLWLRRWDIGSPQLVKPGWLVLEGIPPAHGELRSLEGAAAQIFGEDEPVELHAFLIQAIASGGVIGLVPFAGGFFLHFEDNRHICVTAESPETLKELRKSFQRWNPAHEDRVVARMISMQKARKSVGQKSKKR